jgi:hypothetical protein
MMTPKRRRRSVKMQLVIARAKLRTLARALDAFSMATVDRTTVAELRPDPERFIACWAASRGGAVITQALDASGQVWERHVDFDKEAGKVTAEWWEKVGMERR